MLAGFDRDEYPFAISSQRSGLSIRYVDPTSNRSLGSYLGRQLSVLPDGARFRPAHRMTSGQDASSQTENLRAKFARMTFAYARLGGSGGTVNGSRLMSTSASAWYRPSTISSRPSETSSLRSHVSVFGPLMA